MTKLTKKAVLETLEEKNIKAEIYMGIHDELPVRNPGAAGICTTKKGNLMVYMVNENGKLYNTSVHTNRREANGRLLERLLAVGEA